MTKHTPGPWNANDIKDPWADKDAKLARAVWTSNGEKFICSAIPEKFIGKKEIVDEETASANCKLIAAAPDLLEACEISVPILQQIMQENPHNIACRNTLKWIIAAIEKAEGGTNA